MKIEAMTIFFLAVFIFSLTLDHTFATQAEFKIIKELEAREKMAPPEVIVRPDVQYNAGSLRDPFQVSLVIDDKRVDMQGRVSESTETPPPSLAVQGIIWGGRFPQAIINNKVVKIGDTIDGARIIDITKDGVSVFSGDQQYNLSPPAVNLKSDLKPGGLNEGY